MHDGETPEQLKHELRNVEQEKRALQHLLNKATDHIEELVESDCDPVVKDHAAEAAAKLRRAAQ
ncbi:MAG: hypothetical protein JOZ05_02290, partial [Acetobacteraceae bacterium]|nr:hypothetical protein [Acetobacteraceae bacterium]